MTLFVLASKDGWVRIMYTGLDAVAVDMQVSYTVVSWHLQFRTFAFNAVVRRHKLVDVQMSEFRVMLSSWPSLCQKISKLVAI